MYLFGYSLDNLSLMALTISVGFVVDDAVVMLENIFRYVEEGENPLDAALKGAAEIHRLSDGSFQKAATDPDFLSRKGEAVKKLGSVELGPYGVVRIRTA